MQLQHPTPDTQLTAAITMLGRSLFSLSHHRLHPLIQTRSALCRATMSTSADKPIRIGVIGAGGNTKLHHIPKLQAQDGVSILAVANRTQASAAAVAQSFGIPQARSPACVRHMHTNNVNLECWC